MLSHFSLRDIPLPRNWSENLKTALLHVVSLAHLANIHARGAVANSLTPRVRLAADLSRAEEETQTLEAELKQIEQEYLAKNAQFEAQRSRLASLKQLQGNYEGFEEGLRETMLQMDRAPQIVGAN